MKTITFTNNDYISIINQKEIKCIVLNPYNEIVFDLGVDSNYLTAPYSTREQAISVLHRITDNWGVLNMNLDTWKEKENAEN